MQHRRAADASQGPLREIWRCLRRHQRLGAAAPAVPASAHLEHRLSVTVWNGLRPAHHDGALALSGTPAFGSSTRGVPFYRRADRILGGPPAPRGGRRRADEAHAALERESPRGDLTVRMAAWQPTQARSSGTGFNPGRIRPSHECGRCPIGWLSIRCCRRRNGSPMTQPSRICSGV